VLILEKIVIGFKVVMLIKN